MIYTHSTNPQIVSSRSGKRAIAKKRLERVRLLRRRCLSRLLRLAPKSNSVFEEKATRRTNINGRQWMKSSWCRYLIRDENIVFHEELSNPSSMASKTFRRRFRVPWGFYKEVLLPWTVERFPMKQDAAKRWGVPTELKLLAVLRCLGRATHFDDVAEACNTGDGGECLRTFFHEWCATFVKWGMPLHVQPPAEGSDEMRRAMQFYTDAGLDGCFCSIDGVHFRWDRSPFSRKTLTHVNLVTQQELTRWLSRTIVELLMYQKDLLEALPTKPN